MKQKRPWLVLSLILVVVLALMSCQQGGTTTTGGEGTKVEGKVTGQTTPTAPATTSPPKEPATTTTPPSAETPKYGGTLTIALAAADILGFDEAFTQHWILDTMHLTNEELLSHDWARGPAGTGEADYMIGGINRLDLKAGVLAESWEIPEKGSMLFRLRKGIKFHNKAPVNGRELVADDVVFSLTRLLNEPRSYIKVSYPAMAAATTVTAPDKYTILIKTSLAEFGNMTTLLPDFAKIIPKEIIPAGGDMRDWKVSCGTGPFMLTDFVAASSATLVKNPNYWGKDPVGAGKGNQLPYADGVKILPIPDMSTRYSALRTGKVDWVGGVLWDDAASLRKTNPELKWKRYAHDTTYVLFMRTDKADSPFSKLKVRQALTLGVDYKTLKDVFYGGEALILSWPIVETKEYKNAYVPLEKMPAEVQELYSYNPTKAKQLLTEAGYPNGFKTTVICYNTPTQIDVLSQIKAFWAKIGVDLQIDAKDYAVWTSIMSRRSYDEMLYGYESGIGTFFKMINYNGPSQFNGSYVDDAKVKEAYLKMQDYVAVDEKKMDDIHRELMPYVLSQSWVITRTQPYIYTIWTPWIKNYQGEDATGYYDYRGFAKFIWVDQEMKQKMTGR